MHNYILYVFCSEHTACAYVHVAPPLATRTIYRLALEVIIK